MILINELKESRLKEIRCQNSVIMIKCLAGELYIDGFKLGHNITSEEKIHYDNTVVTYLLKNDNKKIEVNTNDYSLKYVTIQDKYDDIFDIKVISSEKFNYAYTKASNSFLNDDGSGGSVTLGASFNSSTPAVGELGYVYPNIDYSLAFYVYQYGDNPNDYKFILISPQSVDLNAMSVNSGYSPGNNDNLNSSYTNIGSNGWYRIDFNTEDYTYVGLQVDDVAGVTTKSLLISNIILTKRDNLRKDLVDLSI